MAWDVTPGCAQLAVAAEAALDAGDGAGDAFGGVADHGPRDLMSGGIGRQLADLAAIQETLFA